MNLRWLETFRRVVEMQSYTRAAASLNLSQPAVSQQVRGLEQYFAEQLVTPVPRGIKVTDAGQRVYQLAIRIEDDLNRVRRDLAEASNRATGIVRIACGPTALVHYIPTLLQQVWSRYPSISIRTQTIVGGAMTQAVIDGQADVAIQSGAHLDQRLVATPCMEDDIVLVCAPDHPLADAEYLTARDLVDIKVGLIPQPSEVRRLIDAWLNDAGVVLQNGIEFGATEAVRAATLAGLLVGFVSRYSVQKDIQDGRLRLLPIAGPATVRRLYALHHPEPGDAVERLLDVVTTMYADPQFRAAAVAG